MAFVFDDYESLPKYLCVNKGKNTIKYKWMIVTLCSKEGYGRTVVRYAKENNGGSLSKKFFLFEAYGNTIDEAMFNFINKYYDLKSNYIVNDNMFLLNKYNKDLNNDKVEIDGKVYPLKKNKYDI